MLNREEEYAARRVAAAILAKRDAIPRRAADVLIRAKAQATLSEVLAARGLGDGLGEVLTCGLPGAAAGGA